MRAVTSVELLDLLEELLVELLVLLLDRRLATPPAAFIALSFARKRSISVLTGPVGTEAWGSEEEEDLDDEDDAKMALSVVGVPMLNVSV